MPGPIIPFDHSVLAWPSFLSANTLSMVLPWCFILAASLPSPSQDWLLFIYQVSAQTCLLGMSLTILAMVAESCPPAHFLSTATLNFLVGSLIDRCGPKKSRMLCSPWYSLKPSEWLSHSRNLINISWLNAWPQSLESLCIYLNILKSVINETACISSQQDSHIHD